MSLHVRGVASGQLRAGLEAGITTWVSAPELMHILAKIISSRYHVVLYLRYLMLTLAIFGISNSG